VLTHYLKLGSSRERLEQARIREENRLLVTKGELLESGKKVEELYADALNAMRSYQGQEVVQETGGEDYDQEL